MSDSTDRRPARAGYGARQRARRPQFPWVWALSGALVCAPIVLLIVLLNRDKAPADVREAQQFFPEGASVGGVDLSGQTFEEGQSLLNETVRSVAASEVTLTFGERTWAFTLGDIGLTADVSDQLGAAWGNGSEETDDGTGADHPLSYTYDRDKLKQIVSDIEREIDRAPVNSVMSIVEVAKFSYTDASEGYDLNADELIAQIGALARAGAGGAIELKPQVIPPEVTKADLEEATVLLGECVTSLEGSSAARVNNVNIALNSFNFFTIGAGRSVSFNRVVGQRTEEAGFKEATEYAGTTVQQGIGGGVCQASTTIYGAVIRAGLQVLERYNHTMTVSYVPASQDAAVSNNDKDLRFLNNTNSTIYMFAWVDDSKNQAICRIFGKPVDPTLAIDIDSVILQADMPSTAVTYKEDTEGDTVYYTDEEPVLFKQGKPGMRSQAFRVYKDAVSGREIRREKLSEDYYSPENSIYLVGIHKR